ncbi:hypothetical protein [Fulvivirga sedimenti]|uniref:HEPN domain-containing protein n=1 Tax=Fulvivirga sedimenti TaxID=2879465 RepID=A0A9X1HPP2_9BACT|nr:hypothetical protein [Fulvivirga sedimenti]MCA6074039.1 hypothetical protein [Fulvivirga sedimenti]
MYDQMIQTTLESADELYYAAKEELCRPEEDVVPYMVCNNAYKSVGKYLTGYLLKKGIEIHSSMSPDVLLNLCRDVDSRFNDLHLSPLMHTDNPEDVWVNMDTVRKFIDLATQTRMLVGVES